MHKLLFLFLIYSCSNISPRYQIKNPAEDSLAAESLSRSSSKISQSDFGDSINKCYQGEINQGLDQLKQVLDQHKKNINYWLAISTCYRINMNFDMSQYYLDIATQFKKTSKDQAKIENNQGLIWVLQDQFELAYQSFEKALNSSNEFATIKFNLAVLASYFGHYDYAHKLISQIAHKEQDPSIKKIISQINLYKNSMLNSNEVKRVIASVKSDQ
jgi:Tfp pilus assembly protein PilF